MRSLLPYKRVAERAPGRVFDALVRSFRTDEPTGSVRFYVVLTEGLKPIAHGEVIPEEWRFYDGRPGFLATGDLAVVSGGNPNVGWTFVVDASGNAGLLSRTDDVHIGSICIGDRVTFADTLTVPIEPLPTWLLIP